MRTLLNTRLMPLPSSLPNLRLHNPTPASLFHRPWTPWSRLSPPPYSTGKTPTLQNATLPIHHLLPGSWLWLGKDAPPYWLCSIHNPLRYFLFKRGRNGVDSPPLIIDQPHFSVPFIVKLLQRLVYFWSPLLHATFLITVSCDNVLCKNA